MERDETGRREGLGQPRNRLMGSLAGIVGAMAFWGNLLVVLIF